VKPEHPAALESQDQPIVDARLDHGPASLPMA
jgi:hypothetical protein